MGKIVFNINDKISEVQAELNFDVEMFTIIKRELECNGISSRNIRLVYGNIKIGSYLQRYSDGASNRTMIIGLKIINEYSVNCKEDEIIIYAEDKSFDKEFDSDWEIDMRSHNKTAEEILCAIISTIRAENKDEVFYEDAIYAMEEYGKQQHNKVIIHSVKIITDFYGDKGLTNTGNAIKNEILKLLK